MKLLTINSLSEDKSLFLHTDPNICEHKENEDILPECTQDVFDTNAVSNFKKFKNDKNNLLNLFLTQLNLNNQDCNIRKETLPIESSPSFKIILLLEESLKESMGFLKNLISTEKNSMLKPGISCSDNYFKAVHNFDSNCFRFENTSVTFIVNEVECRMVKTLQYLYELLDFDSVRSILMNYTLEHSNEDSKIKLNEITKNNEISTEKAIHPLIHIVLLSSTPLYYEENCINKSLVEWSLMVLVKLAEYNCKRFDTYLQYVNMKSLISGKCGLLSSYLVLKLMQWILPLKSVMSICKHTDTCIYRSFCELCQKVRNEDLSTSSFKVMNEILNFISGMISSHGTLSDNTNNCPCLQELFEEIMKILNKYIKDYVSGRSKNIHLINKGMSLLNTLTSHFNSFEDQFINTQPVYVSLWNEGLSLSFKNRFLQ
ncbi:uncharacterized protein LOC111620484 [Centruroides sculpturatus]|uniref:uncharacterized protein LOC111620484 n=1 Tax=Centruroides sculpturatus TaxID=218467 RepID=UPI000C6D4218|nr:uncharacterized protein LOC111620484 [Centruroides sculpturatus]